MNLTSVTFYLREESIIYGLNFYDVSFTGIKDTINDPGTSFRVVYYAYAYSNSNKVYKRMIEESQISDQTGWIIHYTSMT